MGRYDLSALGWLLFERLCADWLRLAAGTDPAAWSGSADRFRHVVVDDGLEELDPSLAGPTLVATGWVHPGWRPDVGVQAGQALQAAHSGMPERPINSLLVLTNLPGRPDLESVERHAGDCQAPDRRIVLGAEEIGGVIDRDLRLRLTAPFALGVRAGGAGLDEGARERSRLDIGSANALAEVFVATGPYTRALEVLDAHRFCVLTGPPEMGKTAAARMIALALLTAGWEVHECTSPDEVTSRLAPKRRQLFVADDAFGSTEYRADAAERWARELPGILARTDERHWLIWTSRPTPLKAALRSIHRERGGERFPAPAEVNVDAADLDTAEKALILFRHARAAGLNERALEIVRQQGPWIVDHRHFTPERIRRFVHGRLPRLAEGPGTAAEVATAVKREIENPTAAMAASYLALSPSQRAVLVAMLDCPPGVVAERDLAAAARRHSGGGLQLAPFELVDRLADHFLRMPTQTSVSWVHPSWRDLVVAQLAGDTEGRRSFLSRCGHHGILLALSTGGGATGARRLPLVIDDADWDALGDSVARLASESDEHSLAELLDAISVALENTGDDPRVRSELTALASLALDFAAHAHPAQKPVGVELIAAWLRLAAVMPEEREPPWLDATWAALLPRVPPDPESASELGRYEDWVLLASALSGRHLVRLGFPGDQVRIWWQLAEAASPVLEAHPGSPHATRLSGLLMQAGQLLGQREPDLTALASWLTTNATYDEMSEREETRMRHRQATTRDRALVERVLRDLTPRTLRPGEAGR